MPPRESARVEAAAPRGEVPVEAVPALVLPGPAAILALQRSAGNAAVTRALLAREPAATAAPPAPAPPGDAKAAKPEEKPKGPSEADKAEFELMKGAITDATVDAYLEHRRKEFGDKEGSDTNYTTAATEADKEFEGIKQLVGQAEDSIERRKILYRWLRKAYKDSGIGDPPGTIKAGMTPELKKKLDAVAEKMGGRKAGGFAARPQKISGDYRLGTLSEHGTGKAADIAPDKNRQVPKAEWTWLLTFTGKSADLSKATWKASPETVWQAVNDVNEAYKTKLKAQVDAAVKPPEAAKADAAPAKPGEKAPAAPAAPAKPAKVPTRDEAVKAVLKGQSEMLRSYAANGETGGFFELPKDMVVALHGQGLTWGATFPDVDLHHFEMD